MSSPDRRPAERVLKEIVSMAAPFGTSRILFGGDRTTGSRLFELPEEDPSPGAVGRSGGERGGTEVASDRSGAEVYARRWAARRKDLEMEAVSVAAGALLFGGGVFGALATLGAGGSIPVACGTAGTIAWAFSFGWDVARDLLEGKTEPPS